MDQGKRLWQRLILVQGHRRSGTTWLAAVLGKAEEANLIPYEPLWITHQPETGFGERIRELRRSSGWFFTCDPGNPDDVQLISLIRRHLEALVEHYFHGPISTLVVKEPHPNWMPLLRAAYEPDYVLFLDRHPLGILNSYEKSGLYEGWETADEWQKFLVDLQGMEPERVTELEKIRHPAKRVVQMAYTARRVCLDAMENVPHSVVDYEKLCMDPYRMYERVFSELGWDWTDDIREQIEPLVDPDGENESGFVAVRKRSYDRAYAWRRGLAPHTIHSIKRYAVEIGWDSHDEEAARPLSIRECASGMKQYIRRRIQWARRFGPGAVMRGW